MSTTGINPAGPISSFVNTSASRDRRSKEWQLRLTATKTMAAEALAVVGSVSAVVQLVAFSSKCISKGVELYRSGDGILDENAAVELAANHLTTLRVQVEAEAARLSDAVLQEFCRAVANTSSELLKALEKLKIQGNNTKWKTLRKAIKSVWSKEEILDLEHRLSSFRSELNLHITISTK